jgi:hypothetical protein
MYVVLECERCLDWSAYVRWAERVRGLSLIWLHTHSDGVDGQTMMEPRGEVEGDRVKVEVVAQCSSTLATGDAVAW